MRIGVHGSLGPTGNLFIDALPTGSAQRFAPHLERFRGEIGTLIAPAGGVLSHIYFPVGGVISSVTRMQDGSDVEVLLTGRDGFYGLHRILGSETSANDAVVQIPDELLRIPAATFLRVLDDDAAVRRHALRYAQASFEMIAQLSGCNRLHAVTERCARWLLMSHDRVNGDELALTHDYLATMLGVRRPSVSLAAATFERAGTIEYRRGKMRVTNRPLLESAACECYAAVNASFERLMPYRIRKTLVPMLASVPAPAG